MSCAMEGCFVEKQTNSLVAQGTRREEGQV